MFIAALILIFCICVDQYTKAKARSILKEDSFNKGFFSFAIVKNEGAFRGLLQKNKRLLLGIQSASIVIVAILLGAFIHKKDRITTIGLALVLGGAIGNLIDRVKDGYVTDFFAIKWTKNLYYNIADLFVFLGAFITCVRSFFK